MKKEHGHVDIFILMTVLTLMLFSVAFVYSASASFAEVKFGSSEKLFWSHAGKVLLALVVMFLAMKIDYHALAKFSKMILIAAIVCLCVVLVVGVRMKGASRWIHVGPVNFQPSEFAKFALVLYLAAMLAEKKEYIKDFSKAFVPMMIWIGIVVGLIALQPNMSTALVISTLSMIMLFIGEVKILPLLATVGVGGLVGGIYTISAEYRLNRILAYLGKSAGEVAERVNYQLSQALIGFGSGGFFGVGPGQSHQRDFFLPESYGDFIFSVIGEEYGFVGVVLILVAFGVLLFRGIKIARHAPDHFGRYLAFGITITITLYAMINAGVTCGVLPTTGLAMPFISFGGSSVLFSAAAVGVLLNISSKANMFPREAGVRVRKKVPELAVQ